MWVLMHFHIIWDACSFGSVNCVKEMTPAESPLTLSVFVWSASDAPNNGGVMTHAAIYAALMLHKRRQHQAHQINSRAGVSDSLWSCVSFSIWRAALSVSSCQIETVLCVCVQYKMYYNVSLCLHLYQAHTYTTDLYTDRQRERQMRMKWRTAGQTGR